MLARYVLHSNDFGKAYDILCTASQAPYRPAAWRAVTPMLSRFASIISRDVLSTTLAPRGGPWLQSIATGLHQSSTPAQPLKEQNPVPVSPPNLEQHSPASGVVLHTVFDETDHQETHPLLQYRAAYPEQMWTKIHQVTPPSSQRPLAVDLGIGTGRGAIELAKRGFRVIGIESSSNLMASTHHSAAEAGVAVDLIPATLEVCCAGCSTGVLQHFTHRSCLRCRSSLRIRCTN